jgi:uncharacterized membrane protein YhaH (DUF805 family)
VRFLFTLRGRVGRREYAIAGVSLALIKYLGDAALIWSGMHTVWTPLDYVTSASFLISQRLQLAPPWLFPALAAWTLPFVWIGVAMSARRAVDAGRSAWLAVLFFVPVINYVLMVALCVAPSVAPESAAEPAWAEGPRLSAALLSAAAGALVGITMIVVSVSVLNTYGTALFFGAPFVMGALTAFLFNRRQHATSAETNSVVLVMFLAVAGTTLLAGWDGAVCILMALPLALVAGFMGATLGRFIARGSHTRDLPPSIAVMLILPVWAATESSSITRPIVHEVQTSVDIAAPPDLVWPHVIAFAPITEPPDLLFRLGIAYPERADLVGEGVGAIRYCRFSTGPFVEPITVWEPGRRLSFDVTESPAPMRELSLYAGLHPPHLDGILRTRRGEFRLVPLATGGTRLEGSTWYEVTMAPEAYWQVISDALIHRIHARVLDHIKNEVERERTPRPIGGRE